MSILSKFIKKIIFTKAENDFIDNLVAQTEYSKKTLKKVLRSIKKIHTQEDFIFISSEELILQLNQKITFRNRQSIAKIIREINDLKQGTYLINQKLLTDFFTNN